MDRAPLTILAIVDKREGFGLGRRQDDNHHLLGERYRLRTPAVMAL